MTPFAAAVAGGGAGLGGAALAHVLTTLAGRAGAEHWLRGPYGPQFFPVALYTGVLYAAVGGAADRRPATALLGFAVPFLGIVAPMTALTRLPFMEPVAYGSYFAFSWLHVVAALYICAIWGGIAAIGAAAAPAARRLGALAAVGGSLAAYFLLQAIQWAVPAYGAQRWNPTSLVPSPVNLLDGLLSGAALCLAVFFIQRRTHAR